MCQTAILDLDPDGPWLDWCVVLRATQKAPAAAPRPCCTPAALRRALPRGASSPACPRQRPARPPALAPRLLLVCRGMSAEECPHYTNVSFELLSYQLLELRQNVCGDPTPEWDTADEEPPPPPDVLPVEIETPPSGKPFTPGREDAQ